MGAPNFDALNQIDFAGAYIGFVRRGKLFHLTGDSRVPLRLRALRKLAEETKNHDLERDLYIEERKADSTVYVIQQFRDLRQNLTNKSASESLGSSWRLIAHLPWIFVVFLY